MEDYHVPRVNQGTFPTAKRGALCNVCPMGFQNCLGRVTIASLSFFPSMNRRVHRYSIPVLLFTLIMSQVVGGAEQVVFLVHKSLGLEKLHSKPDREVTAHLPPMTKPPYMTQIACLSSGCRELIEPVILFRVCPACSKERKQIILRPEG